MRAVKNKSGSWNVVEGNSTLVMGVSEQKAKLLAASEDLLRLLQEWTASGECFCADNVAAKGICPFHESQELIYSINMASQAKPKAERSSFML